MHIYIYTNTIPEPLDFCSSRISRIPDFCISQISGILKIPEILEIQNFVIMYVCKQTCMYAGRQS